MLHLQAPAALAFYLAALLLTGLGAFREGSALPYLGGLCWVGGTLAALYCAVSLREILVVTLLLGGLSALRCGKRGPL